jgi:hypothetical protein
VGAAHCNYLCKNQYGQVVEVCCCQQPSSEFSCQGFYFCGLNPVIQLAEPTDLQIVCNLTTQEYRPSPQTILTVLEIRNHPDYIPLKADNPQDSGPIGGADISVYIVNDQNFMLDPKYVWPACLPRAAEDDYIPGNKGIFAAWLAPLPTYFYFQDTSLNTYNKDNLYEREALLEHVNCSDPDWMKSSTFYPAGTLCFTDAAWASSVEFGMSGSGLVRPFRASRRNTTVTRYSWAGPLSFSKGSDYTVKVAKKTIPQKFSSNPSVFTDARCYLDWIAAQYNLTLAVDYSPPPTCTQSAGTKAARDNVNCSSRSFAIFEGDTGQILPCNFSTRAGCRLYSYNPDVRPSVNTNVFYCNNTANNIAICANDCPGVDPNAVLVGGEAALFTVAAAAVSSGPSLVQAALGAGSLIGVFGLNSMAETNRRVACPVGQCRSSLVQRCCVPVLVRGRPVCPMICT